MLTLDGFLFSVYIAHLGYGFVTSLLLISVFYVLEKCKVTCQFGGHLSRVIGKKVFTAFKAAL